MESLNELELELMEMIAKVCDAEACEMETLSPDAPIIGPDSPLGLDSLDAVEIVVEIKNRYGVRIEAAQTARQVLASVGILSAYVAEHRIV